MQKHYGTKLIQAKPMNRQAYNDFRGWTLPADEDGADEGYLVEYLDGGKPNVEGFDGYVSWSPKEQFDAAYQPLTALSFGHAIEAAKAGSRISRAGWHGKGMFVVYMSELNLSPYSTQGTERKVHDRTAKFIGEHTPLRSQPYFAIANGSGWWQPGWLPSQADILADDWFVVIDGNLMP